MVVVSPLDLARICSRVLNGLAAEKLGAEFNVSLEPRRLIFRFADEYSVLF